MNEQKEILPCWIVCPPRSGSWHLCDLLHSTQLFGNHQKPIRRKQCVQTPPPYAKLVSAVSSTEMQLTKHKFSKTTDMIPGLKFILLRRADLFAQAVSLYFSEYLKERMEVEKNAWLITDKTVLEKYSQRHVPYRFSVIRQCWQRIIKADRYAQALVFNKPHMVVYYEHLSQQPSDVTAEILQYIQAPQTTIKEHRTLKMQHPLKDKYVKRFKSELSKGRKI